MAPRIIPPSYVWVRAVMWECGEADRQTAVTNIHFASAMPHAKCNQYAKYQGQRSLRSKVIAQKLTSDRLLYLVHPLK